MDGDDGDDDSGPRIKQSILADYVDLVLRIKQAKTIIAWHLMRHPEVDELRRALASVDDVLTTPPVMKPGPFRSLVPPPQTQTGPFPPQHEHTPGRPPPWEDPQGYTAPVAGSARLDGVALTGIERDVLNEVALGSTNKQIGSALGLSEPTVRTHLERMSQKLGAHGRAGLVAKAYRTGLLKADDKKKGEP